MKKTTLLFVLLFFVCGYSQQKSTGVVNFVAGLSANVLLNSVTATATLTINGPSDRWFAITIGNFGQPGAMSSGNDVVYFNGTTLVDATHNGQGVTPTPDTNDWTVVSNVVAGGTRTIVATRAFVAESADYTFNFADTNISLAGAHAASAVMNTLQYHQNNRFNAGSVPFGALGTNDYSLNSSVLYPNPAQGEFTIDAKTFIENVSIYTHSGKLVKTISVNADRGLINIDGLQAGIYLVELQNGTEKSWKKIIVE